MGENVIVKKSEIGVKLECNRNAIGVQLERIQYVKRVQLECKRSAIGVQLECNWSECNM